MKNFFSNKTNIFLIILLVALLGAGSFFAYNVLFKEPEIKAIDFTQMNEQEIIKWANENNCSDLIEIKHEYDSSIKEGSVIYQSIKEGDNIEDKILIIISDGEDKTGKTEIPLTNFKTKEELEAWFKDNNFINVTYEFVEDETKNSFEIISVEPIWAKPEDKVVVKVAQGNLIDVPDLSRYADAEIEKWSKENNVKVIFEYKTSDLAKGAIISQSIKAGEKVSEGSTITLTISSGSSKTATIPATYLGIEETTFIDNLKNLGFTSLKKDETTYYSATSKKGTIFSYDDGTFPTTQVINYAISEGKYEFSESAYNDITLEKAKEKVEALNKRNAHITLNTNDADTDSHTKGTIYDCSSSFKSPNTTITCKLAKTGKDSSSEEPTKTDKTVYIDPYDYLGVSEAKFLIELKALGFTNIVKIDSVVSRYDKGTVCYYLPDGYQKTSTKIEYKVSIGSKASEEDEKEPEKETTKVVVPNITSNPCGGTKNSCTLNGLNYTVKYEESSKQEGTIISVNPSIGSSVNEGSNVVVKISKGQDLGTVLATQAYRTASLSCSTVQATKDYINSVLGDFDLSFETSKDKEYDTGTIISISVNGNTSYSAGSYPYSTKIVVKISSGLSN